MGSQNQPYGVKGAEGSKRFILPIFFFNFKIGRTYGSKIMACFTCTHVLSNEEGSFKETYMLQITETPYRVYL